MSGCIVFVTIQFVYSNPNNYFNNVFLSRTPFNLSVKIITHIFNAHSQLT